MNRRLLVLLLVAAAVLVVVTITSLGPSTPDLPSKEGESPPADLPDAAPKEKPGLGDGCVLSGTIRDREGNPVAGASVGGRNVEVPAFADESGAYRLTGLYPGPTYEIGAMAGRSGRPETVEVSFDCLGEEKHLDFEVAAPPGRALLVSVRFETPPQAEPELRFDLGTMRPLKVPLPFRDALVRCPAPLEAGQKVYVRVSCPGFTPAEARIVMPESDSTVRIDLTLSEGGLPLYGRVVDADGKPVADAEVRACETPDLDAGSYRSLSVLRDGRFRLRADCAGRHLVAMLEGRGVSPWLHLRPEISEVVLVLSDACVVEGRVLDRDTGAPVPAATVKLAFEMNGHDDWTTTSGEDGSYRFAGIPAGSFAWPYVVSTPRAEAVEQAPDHYEGEAKSRTEAVEKGLAFRFERDGEVFRRDLPAVRHRGGNCRFVLVPPEGVEVPERITVNHESRSARWHRTFEWSPELDPAAPAVEIWLEEGTHVLTFRAGVLTGVASGIEVSADGDLPSREVRLETRARVRARLVDREGNRVREKGVQVHLSRYVTHGRGGSGGGIGNARTNEEGEADVTDELPFTDSLDEEGITIRFTLKGDGFFDAWPFGPNVNLIVPGPDLARRIRDAGVEDVVIEVPAWRFLRVGLVVVDTDGNPKAGVRLACSTSKEFENPEVVTDARGIATLGFRFDPKHWGFDAKVEAVAPWIGRIDNDNDDECRKRTKDGRTVFVLTVDRSREVRVSIVTADGRPLARHPVRLQLQYPGVRMATDPEGVIPLRLPEGETQIFFGIEGYTTEWEVVPAGALTHRYNAKKNRIVAVELVVPEDLSAEHDFSVDAEPNGSGVRVERGADGRFVGRLELPVGVGTELTVISPDRRWEARASVGADDDSTKLVFSRRKLHAVTLRLLDEKGEPLAVVTARAAEHLVSRDVHALLTGELRTDAEGRVTIQLPAGEQELTLEIPGYRQKSTGDDFTVPVEKEVVLRYRRG